MSRAWLLVLSLAAPLLADPCGLVPPVFTGDGPPIARIGLQQTYVFYRDGVACIAIRPGFEPSPSWRSVFPGLAPGVGLGFLRICRGGRS